LPSTPTEPATPPVEVSDFVVSPGSIGKPELTWFADNSKTATYSPQGVQGAKSVFSFVLTNVGTEKKAFNPAYSLSGTAPQLVIRGYQSTCLNMTELESNGSCNYTFDFKIPEENTISSVNINDIAVTVSSFNAIPAVLGLSMSVTKMPDGTFVGYIQFKNTGNTGLYSIATTATGDFELYDRAGGEPATIGLENFP
ncbi:MAG: hypothetical protein RR609_09010, partial [Aurantimicrobium sp.]